NPASRPSSRPSLQHAGTRPPTLRLRHFHSAFSHLISSSQADFRVSFPTPNNTILPRLLSSASPLFLPFLPSASFIPLEFPLIYLLAHDPSQLRIRLGLNEYVFSPFITKLEPRKTKRHDRALSGG